MTNHEATQAHMEHEPLEHETSDVDVRGILTFAAGLFAIAVVIHVIIWLLFMYFERGLVRTTPMAYPLSASQQDREPPEPRLQTTPRQDLQNLLAQEDELLKSYEWVDRNSGVVRIPIDEAMRLTIERGLPTRGEQQ